MDTQVFSHISKIIERDSKSSTYKFALLRGVMDIIQDNSPYITFSDGRVHFPTGLLIEKWLLYYYPILRSDIPIPMIHGRSKLAFQEQFESIIRQYARQGGEDFSCFYNDLSNKGIPSGLQREFLALVRKIRETITGMPMRHIGYSVYQRHYSIFEFTAPGRAFPSKTVDTGFLIRNSGTFSIPREYFDAFKFLGSFINGQDSILFKWAEFAVKASNHRLPLEKAVHHILQTPVTERDIRESRQMYLDILRMQGNVHCVWTGTKLRNYDVDHMIPFSVWKNNDLWNLLPSGKSTNNRKRDKIPSPELIDAQKDLILEYWEMMAGKQHQRFRKEIQVALLGHHPFEEWKQRGIEQLKDSCRYLISERGFEAWNP